MIFRIAMLCGIIATGSASVGDAVKPPQPVYLGDVIYGISVPPFPLGRPVGIDHTLDDKPLNIKGVIYEKGMGVGSPTELIVSLDGQYTRFEAEVGVQTGTEIAIPLEITVDGKKLCAEPLAPGVDAKPISINVAGAKEMRLLVGGGAGAAVI